MHQLVADSDTTDSDTTDSESSSSSESPAPSRRKPTNKHPQFTSYPPLLNVNDMTNSRPPDVYLDRQGRQWTLAAWAKPARFFRDHYPLLGLHMEPDPPFSKKLYFTCQTRGCNFQWMMLKKKGWIFRRHHHNHKLDRQTPAQLLRGHRPGDPAPPDAMADLMKLQGWKLLAANVSTEDQLAGIVLKNAVTRAKKTESEFQYCEPFDCRRSRCNYRIRWLPHRSTVWENGSHNHAITAIVRRRMCQLERKKNLGAGGWQAKGKKAKVKKAKTNKSAPSAGTRKSPRLTRKSPRLLKQLQRGRNKKSNNKGMAGNKRNNGSRSRKRAT